MARLRSFGSRQIRIFWCYGTITILLIHSEGSIAFLMMPFFSNSIILFLTYFYWAIGTRRGECCTGLQLGSTTILASPMCPDPLKTSWCLLKRHFDRHFVVGYHLPDVHSRGRRHLGRWVATFHRFQLIARICTCVLWLGTSECVVCHCVWHVICIHQLTLMLHHQRASA